MHDAHGSFVGIQHGDRVQAGLQAKGFQHLGDRPLGRHRRLAYEQGGKIAGFLVESVLLRLRRGQHFVDIQGGELLRAAEQIALDQVDTHLRQYRQLFRQLDAFGDDLRA